jgi:hypothetical protein
MRKSKVVFALNPQTDERKRRKEKDSFVSPHKVGGGKRKGKSLKREPKSQTRGFVTVAQAKEALAIDPNAAFNPETKCLVYFRKVGE